MVFPEIDLAAAVFFVLALVTLARYRPAMRTVDVESYNYTAGGLSVLALVAVFHVLAHAGQGVKDRRLAHVWLSGEGDGQRTGIPVQCVHPAVPGIVIVQARAVVPGAPLG